MAKRSIPNAVTRRVKTATPRASATARARASARARFNRGIARPVRRRADPVEAAQKRAAMVEMFGATRPATKSTRLRNAKFGR